MESEISYEAQIWGDAEFGGSFPPPTTTDVFRFKDNTAVGE